MTRAIISVFWIKGSRVDVITIELHDRSLSSQIVSV